MTHPSSPPLTRAERVTRHRRFWIGPLDKYVFREFWTIFMATALGFPILVSIIDLTDNIDKYLARDLSWSRIGMSYVYWFPDSVFMVLPAAVLFATVFSIGAFTRHSELTAAKASGISFYRMIAPIFAGAALATILGLMIGEVVPKTNKLREEALGTFKNAIPTERYNFAYASEGGRVYKVGILHQFSQSADNIQIERRGEWPEFPPYVISSAKAVYDSTQGWVLYDGTFHLLISDSTNLTFAYQRLVDKELTERPIDLAASPKAPTEMGYRELGRFIAAMERSGANVDPIRVERMLKIAIPFTCLVILLFGAPLATSTQRGGAAYGIGVSLATTVTFLIMIQMTKAFGGKGVLLPELAAWLPSIIFGAIGLVLFLRVRT